MVYSRADTIERVQEIHHYLFGIGDRAWESMHARGALGGFNYPEGNRSLAQHGKHIMETLLFLDSNCNGESRGMTQILR